MPRPLSELHAPHDDTDIRRDLTITRRTTRSFGASIAVLVLATLVAGRSGQALVETPANAVAAIVSGSIELGDDDDGRSLFDLDALTPTRPVERCIEVRYAGTILPVRLQMRAEASGALADHLDIDIERGTGGNYESCAGFAPESDVFSGTLADLVGSGEHQVGAFFNDGDRQTFRIEIRLQDEMDALGQTTDLGISWEATPS